MFLMSASQSAHTTEAEIEPILASATRILRQRGQTGDDPEATRRATLGGFTVTMRLESPGRPRRGYPMPQDNPDPDRYVIQAVLEIHGDAMLGAFRWHQNGDCEVERLEAGSWKGKLSETAGTLPDDGYVLPGQH